MDRITVFSCSLGLLGLLFFQGMISVEGRSIFTSGNHVSNSKEDTQSKILALLLHKTLVPVERKNLLDMSGSRLAGKLSESEELRSLWEDLELERKIAANSAEDKSITRKRGEPCFWKYCV